jgi:hypothetical protein
MPHAIGVAVWRACQRLFWTRRPTPHPGYTVIVTDNFRYMGRDNEWRMGPFATYEEARKKAIDYQMDFFCLDDIGRPAQELYDAWQQYGNTLFIEPEPPAGAERFDTIRFAKILALAFSGWQSTAETTG